MKVLNLGCGRRPDGWGNIPPGAEVVQHDRRLHSPWVEVAHDLREYPWPWTDGEFDKIIAFDIIEHLPDTVGFMDECWRILSADGILYIHTNNAEIPGKAWLDPTHVKAFCLDSFDFFDPESDWGRTYGSFYTDCHWRITRKRPHGTELSFILVKRP